MSFDPLSFIVLLFILFAVLLLLAVIVIYIVIFMVCVKPNEESFKKYMRDHNIKNSSVKFTDSYIFVEVATDKNVYVGIFDRWLLVG